MKKNKILKKIRKLILHPIQFFMDSSWFSKPYFSNKSKPNQGSLCVVSTLGQLHQMEALITRNKINDVMLVILYTKKNMKMPLLIHKSANQHIFRCIYQFELPTGLGNFNLKKFNFIKRGYKALLEETQIKALYMASFAGHYSLLLKLATDQNIETHLVEEGSGTYIPLVSSYNLGRVEKNKLKGYLNSSGYYNKFDHLHVAFPELLTNVFKAKTYNRFFAHLGGKTVDQKMLGMRNKYPISSEDYIYVSQLFPALKDNEYYSTVTHILEEILESIKGKIYIKLHPKEMGRKHIMSFFIKCAKNNNRLVVINEAAFLIEPFIYLSEPKGIIGITSSTLIYTPLMSSQTTSISIANILIESLKYKDQNTTLIESHLEIIKIYKHIVLINTKQNCDDIYKLYEPSMETSELLTAAHNCYINKYFEEAVFYWGIAIKNDISILKNKSLWYYNALHRTKQYYKMKQNEVEYIDTIENFSAKDQDIWLVIKASYYHSV